MPSTTKGGSADLIAHAWYALGYRPRNSLVLVAVLDHLSGPVIRADLPGEEDLAELVQTLLDRLRPHADSVVALVVHDGAAPVVRGVTRCLRDETCRQRLALLDVLHVDSTTYRSLKCTNPRCCPAAGLPLADVLTTPAAAQHVLAGDVLLREEADLVADVVAVPARGDGTTGAREPPIAAGPVATSLPGSGLEWFDAWSHYLRGSDLPPGTARELASALGDVALRDAVLASLAGDDEAATAMVHRRRWTGPLFELRPDAQRLERGRLLLAEAARTADPGSRAHALAVLAWAAWHAGNASARARMLVDLALADDPSHRLAALVNQLLSAAVPPGWWTSADVSECETRYRPHRS
jgi:hypothetical protein